VSQKSAQEYPNRLENTNQLYSSSPGIVIVTTSPPKSSNHPAKPPCADMFFTHYNPALFLTTIAITAFIIFVLQYTLRQKRHDTGAVSVFLALIVFAGLIKYHLVSKSIFNENTVLFLSLAETCFVVAVCMYSLRRRWLSHQSLVKNLHYAYLIISTSIAIDLVILYPAYVPAMIAFLRVTALIFLAAIWFNRRGYFSRLPLLTKSILCLAAYTAISNFAALLLPYQTALWKMDVLVYASLFWMLVARYLKPTESSHNTTVHTTPEPMDGTLIEECLSSLKIAFEDKKLYLDPELTLQSLSAEINISSRTISAVLNREVQKNFHEYLNQYRVEEAKRLLSTYRKRNITIAAVAYEAGFNSLATFQRVFKKVAGKTPREFSENNPQNMF